ncbi:MAG: TonB-dependent receptor plug domain-containing protein [Vicinamibacterales bacterium]
MTIRASAAVLVLLACPPALAFAQDAPSPSPAPPPVEERVVVTGTATEVPFPHVARAIDVITREQIARLPARSIADVLRLAAGIDVRARGEAGVQTDFALRGAQFGQTLVLVDGQRLNDAQSGHHNGDIPVPLAAIERIEILRGPGSSVHGADAFGGTINVITRAAAVRPTVTVTAGEYGAAAVAAAASLGSRGQHLLAGEVSHSDGFTADRDYDIATVSARSVVAGTRLFGGVTRKAFGANGFYGNSPSYEWTNQVFGGVERRFEAGAWSAIVDLSYRTHGDRFRWDRRRPGFAENVHRTHAAAATLRLSRDTGAGRLTIGADGGGDWIRSSNLGDHAVGRASGFAEWQWPATGALTVLPSVRVDHYTDFGTAVSPSLAAGWWLTPALKLRASAARAFRVPTFTELYYTDPNHQGSGALDPEHSTGVDAGLDWTPAAGLTARVTVFGRHDADVIDWVRPSAAAKWRTTNVRAVDTAGVELGVEKALGGPRDAAVGLSYAWLSVTPEGLDLLSKYLLEYAPHSLAAHGSVRLPLDIAWGQRVEYRARYDGQRYWLLDTRVSRPIGRVEVFGEVSNLLDERYVEIPGVAAPPRWVRIGVTVR